MIWLKLIYIAFSGDTAGLPEVQSLTEISFLERLGMMVSGVGSKETKIKKAPEQIAVVISILNLLSH